MTKPSRRSTERLVRGLLSSSGLRGSSILPMVVAFVAGYFLGRGDFTFTTPYSLEEGRVVRVVDGDTLHVIYQGMEEKVRLLCINTPERGQPGYQEAGKILEQLIGTQLVRLEFENPGQLERDPYQRILAYIFIGDTNLNVEMVRSGWTPYWTKYGKGRLADAFERAEAEAQNARRGLWGMEKP